ncbi:MAG: OadG family protein [Eubacteriales bacterium]|nr:OadG family protein [Eubacteriales bacterium]
MLESLSVVIVGMIVVFLGLCILIICINILTKFFTITNKKVSSKKTEESISEEKNTTNQQIIAAPHNVDNKEIIAVISAVIAQCMPENTGFIVKRIKRTSKFY